MAREIDGIIRCGRAGVLGIFYLRAYHSWRNTLIADVLFLECNVQVANDI